MTLFSANLGFLWNDRPLVQGIYAAAEAGFDAVECHWPYLTDPFAVKQALEATGLAMLGLNTARGNVDAGENGLAALPHREDEARAAIDEALAYAAMINAHNIHVMAGFATGNAAERAFLANLQYAANRAAEEGRIILIEPLNHRDAPDYFLQSTDQARKILDKVAADNVKLMFDCYHVQIMEGDLTRRIDENLDIIGHVQFAGVPHRGRPDKGEVNYQYICSYLAEVGYNAPLGAEYKPDGDTDNSLGWMANLR